MGRLIPESEIERVKRSADLVALVQSRGIELRKHGTKDLVGRCPFHQDGETPNLIVSPDKGLHRLELRNARRQWGQTLTIDTLSPAFGG